MRLKPSDKLKVIDHKLEVNGYPFRVEYPDEPLCCISQGKLVTLVIKGCGCTLNQWDPEDIDGTYI